MAQIEINGKKHAFELNHSALKLIKAKHGKSPTDIATGIGNMDAETIEQLLQAGLSRGAVKTGADVKPYTDAFASDALDNTPGLVGVVVQEYGEQLSAMYGAVNDWAEKNGQAAVAAN